jgi:hypothetical protein
MDFAALLLNRADTDCLRSETGLAAMAIIAADSQERESLPKVWTRGNSSAHADTRGEIVMVVGGRGT